MPTIHLLLALATMHDWPLRQVDISNAFLHGDLEEIIYMEQSTGFVHPEFPDRVCLLKKSLYGLKQAPRAWYFKHTDCLLRFGFVTSQANHSLFFFHCDATILFVLVYVDDIIITGNNTMALQHFYDHLAASFPVKDLGPLSFFLGVQVTKGDDCLFLSQYKSVQDLLAQFNMSDCNVCDTPMLSSPISQYSAKPFPDPTLYLSTVGALQYVTLTRHDI